MSTDIDIIKQMYTALNRGDISAVIKLMDKNVFRVEFEGLPGSGTYRGHAEMSHHVQSGRSTWQEGSCEPIEFISVQNKLVVIVHVKVLQKNQTKWIDAQVIDGFSLNNGLITEFHSFTNKEKAMAWAKGVTPQH